MTKNSTSFNSETGRKAGQVSKRGKAKKTLLREKLNSILHSEEVCETVVDFINKVISGKCGKELKLDFMTKIFEAQLDYENRIDALNNATEKKKELQTHAHKLKVDDMQKSIAYKEMITRLDDIKLRELVMRLDKGEDSESE